jgi:hypothetical protein
MSFVFGDVCYFQVGVPNQSAGCTPPKVSGIHYNSCLELGHSGCPEKVIACPETHNDSSAVVYCLRAQGWCKAKRSKYVYCPQHVTQTSEEFGEGWNHEACLKRHTQFATASASTASHGPPPPLPPPPFGQGRQNTATGQRRRAPPPPPPRTQALGTQAQLPIAYSPGGQVCCSK